MLEMLLATATPSETSSIETKALFRTASLIQDSTYASAVGGFLEVKTEEYAHFSGQVRMSTSQTIPYITGEGEYFHGDLSSSTGTSYSLVSLANIIYSRKNIQLNVGRIELDTPFADIDDYRMTTNTFEGFSSEFTPTEDTVLRLFGATRMSGYDSPAVETFTRLSDEVAGFVALSGDIKLGENHLISIWDYYVEDMTNIAYATYNFEKSFSTGASILATAEIASMQELSASSVGGTVGGFASEASHKGFTLGFAYEYLFANDDQYIASGFGGGPYLTTMDNMTFSGVSEMAPGHNIQAALFKAGMEGESYGVEYAVAYYNADESSVAIMEQNIAFYWSLQKDWNLEATLVRQNDLSGDESVNMHYAFVRLDYSFNN